MNNLSPVITGYNLFKTIPKSDSIVTFSNVHESKDYKEDMILDLEKIGYSPLVVLSYLREKMGICLHDLKFRIRGDDGQVLPGLRIKDTRTMKYLNLHNYYLPLVNYPEFETAEGYLVGEDFGWELDLPFSNKEELMKLVALFLNKSGEFIYDSNGMVLRIAECHWRDAWQTPVLLLGATASIYQSELPSFIPVTKLGLKENGNEISFIVHKNLELLRSLPHYKELVSLGCLEELCLANSPFVKRYIDKKR